MIFCIFQILKSARGFNFAEDSEVVFSDEASINLQREMQSCLNLAFSADESSHLPWGSFLALIEQPLLSRNESLNLSVVTSKKKSKNSSKEGLNIYYKHKLGFFSNKFNL